jgi:hypothetical protein
VTLGLRKRGREGKRNKNSGGGNVKTSSDDCSKRNGSGRVSTIVMENINITQATITHVYRCSITLLNLTELYVFRDIYLCKSGMLRTDVFMLSSITSIKS